MSQVSPDALIPVGVGPVTASTAPVRASFTVSLPNPQATLCFKYSHVPCGTSK